MFAFNIHPLFVHFPVALLFLYAIFELLRWQKLLLNKTWFYIKATFLLIGTAALFPALMTGDAAESFHRDQRMLVEQHSTFAGATTFIFSLLTLVYVVRVVESLWHEQMAVNAFASPWRFAVKISNYFSGPLVVLLSLIGLFLLSVTGALGGAIAVGTDGDPFAQFVLAALHSFGF